MVLKKIKQRNSEAGMGELVITVLLVIGIFIGAFLYIGDNVRTSGISIDSKYNATYTNLTDTQAGIESRTSEIKSNLQNITEADSTFQVAWNGLKGIGNTVSLTVYFVNSALGVWMATTFSIDFIPTWVLGIVFTGILVTVVFIILRLFLQGKT